MLCSTCIHAPSQMKPMSGGGIYIVSSFDKIYPSVVLRYFVICTTFAEAIKYLTSGLHVIHENWRSSMDKYEDPRGLDCAYAVDVSHVAGSGKTREFS